MKPLTQKQLLRQNQLAPKKWLGQNFLINKTYLDRIIMASGVQPGQHIVEIGAGLGALTQGLLKAGAKVLALEIDSGLFRVLQEKFASHSGVTIVHEDALKYDFKLLATRIGKLHVVANLPYSISSRLLFRFVQSRAAIRSVHVLLQREVAQRLTAEVGSKDYGILTVLLGVTAQVDMLFDIPPQAFHPVPAVYSTFVRIIFPESLKYSVTSDDLLIRLVKLAFRSRRKTLKNNLYYSSFPGLSKEIVERAAIACSIDLGRRAETLSPQEFAQLSAAISTAHDSLHGDTQR